MGFQVTRNSLPIETVAVKGAVNPGISFSMNFLEWEAAIAAGATLAELLQIERGEFFPIWFREKIAAWHELHGQVNMHKQDAVNKKSK